MDVMPPFLEIIGHDLASRGRRIERVPPPKWSEEQWDAVVVRHVDLLAAALSAAGVIAEDSLLRFLGRQVDNVDIVFAEVSRGERGEARRMVLVEDKLLRNSEARRQVLAQILDYSQTAQEVWSSANLVEKFGARPADRQWIKDNQDALRHICRSGDFLLLIVGDGIDEGLARLAQRFAAHDDPLSLAELALVSLPLYRLGDEYLLVPHVVSAVQRSSRALTIKVVVHDMQGRAVLADVTESVAPATVIDEVVTFLRAVSGRVQESLPGVVGTKVPKKSLNFVQTAPDGSSVDARVHFGGYKKDIWTPIEVGLSVIAPDTRARDEWIARFKEHQAGLPTFSCRVAGPRTMDVLTVHDWKSPKDLDAPFEDAVVADFKRYADVLKAIMASMPKPDTVGENNPPTA